MESENRITEGIIWKEMLIYFFPILVGTFFQQLYNTVDAIIIGRFAGKEALSAVGGSSAMIVALILGFFVGLSSGCTVLLSQYYGAKNSEGLYKALHTAYAFSLIGGILITVVGFFISKPLLILMKTPEDLMDASLIYMNIYLGGLLFIFIYNMGAAILRAVGDSKRPLYFLVICCVINILLDLLLICIFEMGAAGAAIATVIAQGVSAFLVTITLMKHTENLQLKLREIRIYSDTLKGMIKIGFPTGIQACMYTSSNMIVQTALNKLGVDTVAAWAAYGKIDGIFWMINQAFGISVTTFVGMNYGAKKIKRIKDSVRAGMIYDMICGLISTFVLLAFAAELLSIFTTDENVIAIGVEMIWLLAPAYFIFIFIEILSGALRAEGYAVIPTAVTVIGVCLFRIVWILFIIPNGTMAEIVICYPITWVISAVIIIIYYLIVQSRLYKKLINK